MLIYCLGIEKGMKGRHQAIFLSFFTFLYKRFLSQRQCITKEGLYAGLYKGRGKNDSR